MDEPTSLEVEALNGLRKAVVVQKNRKEDFEGLEKIAEKLGKERTRRLPEKDSVGQRVFRGQSPMQENVHTPKGGELIGGAANNPALPPVHSPVETRGSLQDASSRNAAKGRDPVEEVAEKVACTILSIFGVPGMAFEGALNLGV